jgi:ATP-dependent RNA helicase DDX18/HAS1
MVKSKKPKTHTKKDENVTKNPLDVDGNLVAIGAYDLNWVLDSILAKILKDPESLSHTSLIIITQNREKALTLKQTIKSLTQSTSIVTGIKGNNISSETLKFQSNPVFLITTPEKFKYHIENTKNFLWQTTKYILIDGLDRIINTQYDAIEHIFKILPSSIEVKALMGEKTQKSHNFIDKYLSGSSIIEERNSVDPSNLAQKYVKVPADYKFLLLYTFMFRNQSKRILVIISCSSAAKFYKKLLNSLGLKAVCLDPMKSAEKQSKVYSDFTASASGILISTMACSSRFLGTDLNYLILYNVPDIQVYTKLAASLKDTCKIIFFIDDSDEEFAKNSGLRFSEMKFSVNSVLNIQPKIEKIIERNYALHKAAREGYREYILTGTYKQYQKIAKSFGFQKPFLVNGLNN